jgi:mono/diheme cytochrome c family protein
MHRATLSALACAVLIAAQASGADVERGHSLYSQLCAACHQGQQSTTGQALRAAAGAPARILEAMRNIGAMAPLRSIVTDAMAADIAAWLATVYPPGPQ